MRSHAAALLLAALLCPPSAASEFPANRLYVCSQTNDRILTYDGQGHLVGAIGASTQLVDPDGVAFGPDGLLYVVSSGDHTIHVYDSEPGGRNSTFGAGSGLLDPRGIAFGPGGRVHVGDGASDSVFVFAGDGALLGTIGSGSGLEDPSDLLFSADGHLFVASAGVGRVHEFDPSGELVRVLGEGTVLESAGGLALAPDGRLFVSSVTTDSVLVFDAAGALVDELGEGTGLVAPAGLAIGPHGHLTVVSAGSNQVLVIDDSGQLVDGFGKSLGSGTDLAWSPVRFRVTARGDLQRDGQDPESVQQQGVLSIQPGSQVLMLALEPAVKGADLIEAFGGEVLLLPGSESFGDPTSVHRLFDGVLVPDDQHPDAAGALALHVGGRVDKQGLFQVRRARGTFLRAGAEGLFVGSAATGKRLN